MGTRGHVRAVESRGEQDQEVRLAFGGCFGDEYLFRGMTWADNYWLFSDDKEKLVCMVNDIVEELPDLDMEPKLESLEEDATSLKVEGREKTWDPPFMEVFDVLGYPFRRDGKGMQGTEKTLREGLGSWWRAGYIYRAKSVPLKTECHTVVSHVFSVSRPWSVARTTNTRHWDSKILPLAFRPKKMKAGRNAGGGRRA